VTGQTKATWTATFMFQLKANTHDESYYKLNKGTTIVAETMIRGFILKIYNYCPVRPFRLALHALPPT
jgi:hypothetical protein